MHSKLSALIFLLLSISLNAQDLSKGLVVNDLTSHPMQDIEKPAYLNTIIDPSFGTTIRRITDAGIRGVIVPMYSTVQAWNADESLMILYNQSRGYHELLDGNSYEFIRVLEEVEPADLEQIFWDFNDPDILYYPESLSNNFIRYSVSNQTKQTIVNLGDVSGCVGGFSMGNDIQMMSWDSDVFTFRCGNETAYSYRISTEQLTIFDIQNIGYAPPGVAPSGMRYYHRSEVYNNTGNNIIDLNINSVEHSCIGRLVNGNDAYFAIAFAEGPQGGCIGDIIAHDLTTGECFPVISQSQGYNYPQSGVHISALAHKNTEGGWMAASMIGYDQDGQSLLDQELVIAKAEDGSIKVCRIGHHRSDEDQFDYWGEPHAVISPTGTRVLFASDWSGLEDGQSVDSYVVDLPILSNSVGTNKLLPNQNNFKLFPNPVNEKTVIEFENPNNKQFTISIFNSNGVKIDQDKFTSNQYNINTEILNSGLFLFRAIDSHGNTFIGKFIKN